MSEYSFSNKSKIKRLLMTFLAIFLVLLISTSIYFLIFPKDKECNSSIDYYSTNDEQYNDIIKNGAISCSQEYTTVKYSAYINNITEESDKVILSFNSLNDNTDSINTVLNLPKTGNYKSFLTESNLGYFTIVFNFTKSKNISSVVSSFCNLLNLENCHRNISLDNWSLERIEDVNTSNVLQYQKDILKRGSKWLMLTTNMKAVMHIFDSTGINFRFFDYEDSALPYSFVSNSRGISDTWKLLNDDTEYITNTAQYIKDTFNSLEKKDEDYSNINCLDIYSIIENINQCGEECSSILDNAFVTDLESLCKNNKTYENALAYNLSNISKYKNNGNYRSTMFKDFSNIVNGNADEYDSNVVNDASNHSINTFSAASDSLKGFAYWLYNIKNPSNKEEILKESYVSFLNNVKKDLEYNYYGICEIGTLAMDYYSYTNDVKYMEDAKFIYENGNIVNNNVLPSGISSYYMRESTACVDFLIRYNKATKDELSLRDALAIVSDRFNRSLEATGFGGSYLTNGILADSDDFEINSKRAVAFYDYIELDDSKQYVFFTDTQAYILSVLSNI